MGVGREEVEAFVVELTVPVSDPGLAVRGFLTAFIKVSIGACNFRLVALMMRPCRLVVFSAGGEAPLLGAIVRCSKSTQNACNV